MEQDELLPVMQMEKIVSALQLHQAILLTMCLHGQHVMSEIILGVEIILLVHKLVLLLHKIIRVRMDVDQILAKVISFQFLRVHKYEP